MPEVNGRHYPYTEGGKRQAEIDTHQQQAPKHGSADFTVEPDKLNYDRYFCGRPYDTTLGYDGNLTLRGKLRENPLKNSRPNHNGMFPSLKKPGSGGSSY